MLNLFIRCFSKKYFQFKGRASRKEYLSFLIFDNLLLFFMGILNTVISSNILIMVITIYALVSVFPSISVTIRRMHDINLSGWWCLALTIIGVVFTSFLTQSIMDYIVLCIVIIIAMFIICKKGDPTANKYGEPPTY
jgi:uncharacterized membrane protein YhaH (DUF805 family)